MKTTDKNEQSNLGMKGVYRMEVKFPRSITRMLVVLALLTAGEARADFTIGSIDLLQYKLQRKTAFVTSKGSSDACPGIFVVLKAADPDGRNLTAVGEILPRGLVTNETQADAWRGAQVFREKLLGKTLPGKSLADDTAAIRGWMKDLFAVAAEQKLETKTPPLAHRQLRSTLCGYDMALLDLVGQIHGVSIAKVLGEARKEVTISATTYGADIEEADLENKIDDTNAAYKAVRLKIGLDDESDISKLHTVAQAMVAEGKGREIWVDVNQAWKTAEKSIAMLGRIRDMLKETGFKAHFICEQPTYELDIPALAAVTKEVRQWGDSPKMVIMADEAMWDKRDAEEIVKLEAADAVNIKIVKAGGLLGSLEIGQYLAEHAPNMQVYVGGLIMTDISAAANLQLCLALPRLDYASGPLPRTTSYPVNPATVPLKYVSGRTLAEPAAPGLGTGLDVTAVQPFVSKTFPK
ncbi:hypothetical protein BH09VER1_BH09VER1_41570 [soil metagenome]